MKPATVLDWGSNQTADERTGAVPTRDADTGQTPGLLAGQRQKRPREHHRLLAMRCASHPRRAGQVDERQISRTYLNLPVVLLHHRMPAQLKVDRAHLAVRPPDQPPSPDRLAGWGVDLDDPDHADIRGADLAREAVVLMTHERDNRLRDCLGMYSSRSAADLSLARKTTVTAPWYHRPRSPPTQPPSGNREHQPLVA